MKKIVLLLMLAVVSIATFAQDGEFMGTKFGTSKESFAFAMKQRGFTVTENAPNVTIMKGMFIGKPVELYVFHTPKTKQVWKVDVYFEKKGSYGDIIAEFKWLLNSYKAKFGEYQISDGTFKSPYYEGDGYELQAVKTGNTSIYVGWKLIYNYVTIEVTEFAQNRITYSSISLEDLFRDESQSIINSQI